MFEKFAPVAGITPFAAAIVLACLALGCQPTGTGQASNAEPVPAETPAPAESAPQDSARPASAEPAQEDSARPTGATVPSLTLVTDRSLVCMVNNQFMDRPQIPIEVEGRTYYGCCEMCRGRLGGDPSSRASTDPVTGNTVDKATAVIGRTADGSTLYFENDQTFAAYQQRAAQ